MTQNVFFLKIFESIQVSRRHETDIDGSTNPLQVPPPRRMHVEFFAARDPEEPI
jgi:hypothetical protein